MDTATDKETDVDKHVLILPKLVENCVVYISRRNRRYGDGTQFGNGKGSNVPAYIDGRGGGCGEPYGFGGSGGVGIATCTGCGDWGFNDGDGGV